MNVSTPFLCFVHIEKAGGITLHNILHENYFGYVTPSPKKKFGEHFDAKQLKKMMSVWPIHVTGIGGHRVGSFLNYESVIKQPIYYFTFVRSPINRFISHFNWQRNVKGINWTLKEFVTSGYFSNFQCFRISGHRNFEVARGEIEQKFRFVGLMENYDESLLMLSRRIRHPFNPVYIHSNKKDYGSLALTFADLDSAAREEIIDANREDEKLYNYIHQTIFKRQQSETPISDIELASFRKSPKHISKRAIFKRKLTNRLSANLVQPWINRS